MDVERLERAARALLDAASRIEAETMCVVPRRLVDALRSALAAQPAQAGERVMVENDCKPLIRAVREADEAHQKSGGGTNHYVRDCLLPALAANGLRVADNSRPAGFTAPASAEAVARAVREADLVPYNTPQEYDVACAQRAACEMAALDARDALLKEVADGR